MPELPDVEIFKRYLDATALRKKIKGSNVHDADLLDGVSRQKLQRRLHGERFRDTHRHGKFLFARFGASDWLILHFGMTGFLKYHKNSDDTPDHTRLTIDFANGYHLAYSCQRKLGKISHTDSVDHFIENQGLGPDCYSDRFSFEAFTQALGHRSGAVKSSLMNQNRMAGLGNIYSDEILYQTGIHPESAVTRIDEETRRTLYRAMRRIVRVAIDRRVTPEDFPRNYLIRHREEGAGCPRCGGTITRMKISGRSAYVCPYHQEKV